MLVGIVLISSADWSKTPTYQPLMGDTTTIMVSMETSTISPETTISITDTVEDPPILEANETVKTGVWTEQTVHASNTLKNNSHIRNIGYYNGYWWWATQTIGAFNEPVLNVWKANDFNAAPTLVHQRSIGSTGNTNVEILLRVFDDEIYCIGIYSAGAGIDYSTNGGSTWSTRDIGYSSIIDIVQFAPGAARTWLLIGDANVLTAWRIDGSGSSYAYTGLKVATQAVYGGIMSGATYYCGLVDTSDDFRIVSFAEGAWALVETYAAFTVPATLSYKQQQFLKIGNVNYIIDQDHLYSRVGSNAWAIETASGIQSTGVIWDYNASYQYTINYLIWNDKIYWISPQGGHIAMNDWVNDARVGFDDWFVDCTDAKIYKYVLTTNSSLLACILNAKREDYASFDVVSNADFDDDTGIRIYNDSDAFLCQGVYERSADDTAAFNGSIKSFSKSDLNKPITYSGTAKTVAIAVAEIMAANFEFCAPGTISSSATTYNWSFTGRKAQDVLTEMCHTDGRIWYIKGDDTLWVDIGTTDTTVNILSSADQRFSHVFHSSPKVTLGGVEFWGKNGAYIKQPGTYGNEWISDTFFDLAQTELAALAAQYLAKKTATYNMYKCQQYAGAGLIQVGQQIDWECDSPYVVTSAKFYIYSLQYDVLNDIILDLVLHDVLTYNTDAKKTPDQAIEYTRQVETTVATVKTTADAALAKTSEIVAPIRMRGLDTFVENSYFGCGWSVNNSANDPRIHAVFAVTPGTYTLYIVTANSEASENTSANVYISSNSETWNVASNQNWDITGSATTYKHVHTAYGATITITTQTTLVVHWTKDSDTGAGTFYVHGMYLLRLT